MLHYDKHSAEGSMPRKVITLFLKPLEKLIKIEASSGIILMICAIVAMYLANSPHQSDYFYFLEKKIFSLSVLHWVNDALMAVFFFVVGLEIKREIVVGELSTFRKSALPIASAIGGMIVPALIYFFFNNGKPSINGWAIPMATDIAFALGVLTLFGKRVPLALKIFLLALAIVDDLGAVLVIAFFYTEKIKLLGVGLAGLALLSVFISRKFKVRSYLVYSVLGVFAWAGVLYSGVHATIAGVLLGLMTPYSFPVKNSIAETYSPIEDLIHYLHPFVGFLIMPIFALGNAGVQLSGIELASILDNSISMGIILGLVVGKPVGIIIFSVLVVGLKLADLPDRVSWNCVLGVSLLAGIGFTMSIFISTLALNSEGLVFAKLGILVGSLISALLGGLVLMFSLRKPEA